MVYSTLLEYDDKTAIRPYQKLSFLRNEQYQKASLEGSSQKIKKKGKGQENIFGDEQEFIEEMNELDELEFQKLGSKRKSVIGGRNILNLVQENLGKIEEAMLVEGFVEEEMSEEVKLMNILANEKQFHDEKMERLRKRLQQI